MPSAQFAAYVLFALLGVLALFQLALALGAPLGRYAMGGMVEGAYPAPMRIAALAQIAIYALIGAITFSRLGWAFPGFAQQGRIAMWIVVGLFALGTLMNAISRSAGERAIWTPVALVMALASLRIALA